MWNEQTAPVAAALPGTEIAASLVPRLAATEREHDLAGRFAEANLAVIADAGLLGLNVPAELGGIGESLSGTVETLRVIAHGSPSAALMLAMHTSTLSHYTIDPRHIPARERTAFLEQREWAYREALDGRIFGVANSEAGAGGDVKRSKARIEDGLITGVKSFCSMGTHADYFLAAARDEAAKVDYYLVRNEAEKVSVAAEWDAIGMRSSDSVSLRFDGAPVIGAFAYKGLIDGVNNRHWATVSFAAIFTGIAESLLEEVSRQRGGILHQTNTVDLHLTVQSCLAFFRHCVATEPEIADAAYRRLVRDCKLFVTRSLAQQASALYIAQGGSAYRFGSSVSRKLRDLLAGPAVRPPVGVSFDELWEELAAEEKNNRV
jgi:alkylation response protein AidB-like acyl-CoA dehydrogenase